MNIVKSCRIVLILVCLILFVLVFLGGNNKTPQVNNDSIDISVDDPERIEKIYVVPAHERIVISWDDIIENDSNIFWCVCDEKKKPQDTGVITKDDLTIQAFSGPGVLYVFYGDDDEIYKDPNEKSTGVILVVCTGLPTVYIETSDELIDPNMFLKDEYHGSIKVFYPEGLRYESVQSKNPEDFTIRVRGNATKEYPKKPYRITLPEKINMLDMSSKDGRDKNWILLANYCDKTLLRTQISLYVATLINGVQGGNRYVPQAMPVDVVINGEYCGNYSLVESVRASKDRVYVNKSDNDLGGIGFIAENDAYYQFEPNGFEGNMGYGYSFEFPDEDDPKFDQHVQQFKEVIIDVENSLLDLDSDKWMEYIDLESFASWFIIQNILANKDPNWYFFKKDSSNNTRIEMGPVWDFEWSFGIGRFQDQDRPVSPDYWCAHKWWFRKLMKREDFVLEVKNQWGRIRETYPDLDEMICNKMKEYEAIIHLSRQCNFLRWPILDQLVSVGGKPLGSYEAELECDMEFVRSRIKWLDESINNLPESFFKDE